MQGTAELDLDGANDHISELSRRYEGTDFHTPVDRVIVRIKARAVLDYGIG